MAIFEKKVRVDISKVNSNALITNKGMLGMLENVACMHSDLANCGILDIPRTHLSWVQLNWKVQINRRLKYGEIVTIKTWARNTTKVSTLRDFKVLDEQGNIVCIAITRWTLTSTDTHSITRIPEDLIAKYSPDDRTVLPDFAFKKLTEPQTHSNEYIYETQRRDIDVNKHMHNLNYLDLAYEALPENVYLESNNNDFNDIEIMYKSAIKLGDTSKCLYSFDEGRHTITIKSLDDKVLHCIITLQ